MTIAEKIEMYKGKKEFIDCLSKVFEQHPKYHTVDKITYEVWSREVEGHTYFREWVIVHFKGGSTSPRQVSGNSNIANFRILGDMIDGGYYDEMSVYVEQPDHGFEFVVLQTGSKLDAQLLKPMTHISDVHQCFEYCTNIDDVAKVIDRIPSMFGTFTAYVDGMIGSFRIINDYEENGNYQSDTIDYDFYEE